MDYNKTINLPKTDFPCLLYTSLSQAAAPGDEKPPGEYQAVRPV